MLINLLDGLMHKHVDDHGARTVIGALQPYGGDAATAWCKHKLNISSVIFAEPDNFQYQGPPAHYSPAEWMTIKSMTDLMYLLRSAPLDTRQQQRLRVNDPDGAHQNLEDEYYIRFAETLSDEQDAVTFLLAKAFLRAGAAVPRPAPSWYSRWCQCDFRDQIDRPSSQASGRFRDWLGLNYGLSEPLFVIRARTPLPVKDMKAHRPTPWDGFDNPLYKHRAPAFRESEGCGSTADIEKLRMAAEPSDIEGGPEIVSRGVRFDPARFVCEYLGMSPSVGYGINEAPFHKVLLTAGRTMDDVLRQLLDRLAPLASVPA